MSRTPQELLTRIAAAYKRQVDDLEKKIDAEMDRSYTGSYFRCTLYDLNEVIIAELRRRYTAWEITYSKITDAKAQETHYVMTFTPVQQTVVQYGVVPR